MFDLMQYALIFYDFQLILAQMGEAPLGGPFVLSSLCTPYTSRRNLSGIGRLFPIPLSRESTWHKRSRSISSSL